MSCVCVCVFVVVVMGLVMREGALVPWHRALLRSPHCCLYLYHGMSRWLLLVCWGASLLGHCCAVATNVGVK